MVTRDGDGGRAGTRAGAASDGGMGRVAGQHRVHIAVPGRVEAGVPGGAYYVVWTRNQATAASDRSARPGLRDDRRVFSAYTRWTVINSRTRVDRYTQLICAAVRPHRMVRPPCPGRRARQPLAAAATAAVFAYVTRVRRGSARVAKIQLAESIIVPTGGGFLRRCTPPAHDPRPHRVKIQTTLCNTRAYTCTISRHNVRRACTYRRLRSRCVFRVDAQRVRFNGVPLPPPHPHKY